ncbi:type I-B CRISPR-associated protein Cas5b [Natrinema halophilum]|uniref:Type I-B CRISPR-associated protein Cas5 n=1 Tax=Natrinema halophilum TaxID=1699371 RepID=A0A7D5H8J3_9EURY|nr:type I-B CRISPR-associated protein Cas5b [Natrinema halophilum]QLG49655.1 type I-B CRISPR-associated protein Cas5b [Natrinema halophilum]
MGQESLEQWSNDGDNGESADSTEVPDRCLSITIRGPWGHFRRIEGNIVKQTYRIIPRTTVAGLLAAVMGIERDGYYELFSPGNSAIAIEPVREIRTINMPMNTLSTSAGNLQSLNGRGKISVKLPDPTTLRQQHNYEVLVEPAYRIDVSLANDERYRELRNTLEAGKSHYVPSLGLSEHLAEIEYHGNFEVETDHGGDQTEVNSAVPNAVEDVVLEPGTRCQVEESPAFMRRDAGGRTTAGFTAYTYNPDAGPLTVKNVDPARVDGRTVVFV